MSNNKLSFTSIHAAKPHYFTNGALMKTLAAVLLTLTIAFAQACSQNPKGAKVDLKNEKDSASYALGMNIGQNLKKQGFDLDLNIMFKSLEEAYKEQKMVMDEQHAMTILQNYAMKAQQKAASEGKKKGEEFLAQNRNKPGVKVTPSGLQYIEMKAGTGEMPHDTSKVRVHYTGTLIDGTKFDSSVDRGEPAEFPVNGVIKGWTEALKMMKVGSKWKLFIPSDLAYGEHGQGPIPANSVLVFEVELLGITK